MLRDRVGEQRASGGRLRCHNETPCGHREHSVVVHPVTEGDRVVDVESEGGEGFFG